MPLKMESASNGIVIHVKVVPNASRDLLAGLLGDALKIKVAKPPENGQANHAVESLLARTLGIPPSRVSVIAGHSQPQKRILLVGLDPASVERLLLAR